MLSRRRPGRVTMHRRVRSGALSLGVLLTLLVVVIVASVAAYSLQGIVTPAEERVSEQTDRIPERGETNGGGVESTNIEAAQEFVVCPASCGAVINTDKGSQTFSRSGNYRLPFLSLHSGETTTVNSVSDLPAGCSAWLHQDLRGVDQEQWYSQAPEGSLEVKSGQELESHDAEFAVIAPKEQSCREGLSLIRYVVRGERNDHAVGGGKLHTHVIFSAMHDSTRDYRITLQNEQCEVERDTGWNSYGPNAWWWKGWKVDDPDSNLHQPYQVNIWNREHSADEPEFTFVGCEPGGSECPGATGYGEAWCTPGESDSSPDEDPTISNVEYEKNSGNELDFTVSVENNDDYSIRAMVKFEQNNGDVYGNCPGGAGCPTQQIEGGGAAVFEHTTNWKSGYGRADFKPDFDISLWVENSDGDFELVNRENYECCPGTDTGSGTESWDFTINSAEIYENGHKDATTRSDPKAKVTLADNSHEETSKIDDAQNPEWDATLFTDKPREALTALTIDIDDYDDTTWDDDIGECDFNVDDSNFEDGSEFTLTKSCGTVFDVTFTISPAG